MEKKIGNFHSGRAIFSLLVLICCFLIGAVLKIASSVILPFVLALLLAFVMFPIVKWLDKYRVPRFASILLIIIIIISGLYLFGMVLLTSGNSILSIFPEYESRLMEIYMVIAELFELPSDESLSLWQNLWGQLGIRTWVGNFAISISGTSINFASTAVLVILFIVFILLEAGYFKEKLQTAFGERSAQVIKMGHSLMVQVTRYLTAKFFISLATGVVIFIGLSLIKVEFAILWGIFAFILNFIPVLGSIAGGVVTSLFALVQFWPEPVPVILVVVLILSVNMIIGNIIDPKIIGDHVGISPLMVMVSLGFWGYIWGFAGMVIAVPMTVIIKIICENIPLLEPVSVFIGSKKAVKAQKKYPQYLHLLQGRKKNKNNVEAHQTPKDSETEDKNEAKNEV